MLLANVAGERTDFIRLNNGDVRQAGSVDQRTLTIDLIEGRRHVGGSIRLSGVQSIDDARLTALVVQLRDQRRLVADDPFLLYNTEPTSTERIERGSIPEPDAALADIRAASNGRDLVGIYAVGRHVPGLRQQPRPAQLVRVVDVQPRLVLLPPRRQGSEEPLRRLRLERRRLRRQGRLVGPPAGRARTRSDQPVARRLPHVPRPTGDGGAPAAPVVLRSVRAPGPRDPPDPAAEDARRRREAVAARCRSARTRPTAWRRTSSRPDSCDPTRCR